MPFNKKTGLYEGYIYLVTNNINNKKYVGQTICSIQERWNGHTHYRESSIGFDVAVHEYGKENFVVEELEKLSASTKDELQQILNEKEIYYIKRFSSLVTEWGYNIDAGGRTNNSYMHPVVAYNLGGEMLNQFDSYTDAANYYNVDPKSISKCCFGMTPNVKGAYVFRCVGDPFNKYSIESPKTFKNYYKWTKDGELVGHYYTRQEAIANGAKKNISCVLDNPTKTCGGYWWSSTKEFKYLSEYQPDHCHKYVDLYDLYGNFVKTFRTIADCAKYVGANRSTVLAVCDRKTFAVNNYICLYNKCSFDEYVDRDELSEYILLYDHPVAKYDKDGNVVASYSSIHVASLDLPKKTLKNIYKCCIGERNTVNGFFYRFAEDPFSKYKNTLYPLNKPMNVYRNEYYQETFYYTDDIRSFLGREDINQIYGCAKGKAVTAYGYRWFYVDDQDQPDKSKIMAA